MHYRYTETVTNGACRLACDCGWQSPIIDDSKMFDDDYYSRKEASLDYDRHVLETKQRSDCAASRQAHNVPSRNGTIAENITINQLVEEAHRTALAHGWYDKGRSLTEAIMLVVCELAEAIEEIRNGHQPHEIYYVVAAKPEGVPIEIADAIIRLADLCGWYGIDLQAALNLKLAYNKTRTYRHAGKAL